MAREWIKNREQLEITKLRGDALDIVNAGYEAIETSNVISESIEFTDKTLIVKEHSFDVKNFDNIYVLGMGKASCLAAATLETILGAKIKDGVIIDMEVMKCNHIRIMKGSHPKPTYDNVEATKKLVELAQKATKNDLYIVIVTGGGSSLMCWPLSESEQSSKLYDESIKASWNIYELNTIRKHISGVKGGGLAKMLYPATVVGLIFSDIPGNELSEVASGPTYKDKSSIKDAYAILKKSNLENNFVLNETPKDDKYFKNVTNIPLVTSMDAMRGMAKKAESMGYEPFIIERPIIDYADKELEYIFSNCKKGRTVISGGEVKIKWPKGQVGRKGHGGRNQHLSLLSLDMVSDDQVFISYASDGIDNSDSAGAIGDAITRKKANDHKLDRKLFLENMNTHIFFEVTGDLIFTGPTKANVSDIQLLLCKK